MLKNMPRKYWLPYLKPPVNYTMRNSPTKKDIPLNYSKISNEELKKRKKRNFGKFLYFILIFILFLFFNL